VTHTYITSVAQPTLHCLTRSVRRRAASFEVRLSEKWRLVRTNLFVIVRHVVDPRAQWIAPHEPGISELQ